MFNMVQLCPNILYSQSLEFSENLEDYPDDYFDPNNPKDPTDPRNYTDPSKPLLPFRLYKQDYAVKFGPLPSFKRPRQKVLVLNESQRHPFHIVRPSYWPFFTSVGLTGLCMSIVWYFQGGSYWGLAIFFGGVTCCMVGWLTDVTIEATYERAWTKRTEHGIRLGFGLFIVSEVMFFFSFFWAYLHTSLNPSVALGCVWPPLGIQPIDFLALPLLNTGLLIFSGISVTLSQKGIKRNAMHFFKELLDMTIVIGILFTVVQFIEYIHAGFSMQDSVYGSLFYMMTGFHGLHVIGGTLFLAVNAERADLNHFTYDSHLGVELASWYWHFVDIVWILLYLIVYWWGS